jgi:hypothetical protein
MKHRAANWMVDCSNSVRCRQDRISTGSGSRPVAFWNMIQRQWRNSCSSLVPYFLIAAPGTSAGCGNCHGVDQKTVRRCQLNGSRVAFLRDGDSHSNVTVDRPQVSKSFMSYQKVNGNMPSTRDRPRLKLPAPPGKFSVSRDRQRAASHINQLLVCFCKS